MNEAIYTGLRTTTENRQRLEELAKQTGYSRNKIINLLIEKAAIEKPFEDRRIVVSAFWVEPKVKSVRSRRDKNRYLVPQITACLKQHQPASAKFIAEMLGKKHAAIATALAQHRDLFYWKGKTKSVYPKQLWRLINGDTEQHVDAHRVALGGEEIEELG